MDRLVVVASSATILEPTTEFWKSQLTPTVETSQHFPEPIHVSPICLPSSLRKQQLRSQQHHYEQHQLQCQQQQQQQQLQHQDHHWEVHNDLRGQHPALIGCRSPRSRQADRWAWPAVQNASGGLLPYASPVRLGETESAPAAPALPDAALLSTGERLWLAGTHMCGFLVLFYF